MALDPWLQSVYSEAWQLVQDAAKINPDTGRPSYTSADVQQAAGELFARASGAQAFAFRSALATLYGMATRSSRAAQALTTAGVATSIDASMIGEWPTAAPLTVQAAQPTYMAKMQFTYTSVLGVQHEAWVTITGLTQVPQTAGQLEAMLTGRALTAYTTPQSEGGSPLPGEMLSQFGEVMSMQLYAVLDATASAGGPRWQARPLLAA